MKEINSVMSWASWLGRQVGLLYWGAQGRSEKGKEEEPCRKVRETESRPRAPER